MSLPMPAVASAFTIHCPALSTQVDGNSRASREKGSSPISPKSTTRGNSSGLASGMLQLIVSFPLPQSSNHSCKRKANNKGDDDDDDDGEDCRASKSKRTDSNPSIE
ncbi:hypothetical protein LPJ75_005591 [Coemansia sp. RSA 2598]|nr:hypothetical protein LPJ75_005591 [Coemansia sp. RSA 2598]